LSARPSATPHRTAAPDALGVAASAACIVHCLAAPVLIAAIPALTWMTGEATHLILAIIAGLIFLAAVRSWPAGSRGTALRLTGFVAVLGLFLTALLGPPEAIETVLTVFAASLLAGAHVLAHLWRRG
jgi:hypothetical protein